MDAFIDDPLEFGTWIQNSTTNAYALDLPTSRHPVQTGQTDPEDFTGCFSIVQPVLGEEGWQIWREVIGHLPIPLS